MEWLFWNSGWLFPKAKKEEEENDKKRQMDLMRKLESVAKVWCYACNKRSIINEYDEMQNLF